MLLAILFPCDSDYFLSPSLRATINKHTFVRKYLLSTISFVSGWTKYIKWRSQLPLLHICIASRKYKQDMNITILNVCHTSILVNWRSTSCCPIRHPPSSASEFQVDCNSAIFPAKFPPFHRWTRINLAIDKSPPWWDSCEPWESKQYKQYFVSIHDHSCFFFFSSYFLTVYFVSLFFGEIWERKKE